MSGITSNEIMRSIRELDLTSCEVLSEAGAKSLQDDVVSKYASSNSFALWEYLEGKTSFQDDLGWRVIPHLIGSKECIMFLEDEKFAVKIPNGDILLQILEDTFGYVFYVTDADLNYVICHNDHDFIIGCGEAAHWIEHYYTPL